MITYSLVTPLLDVSLTRILLARLHLPYRVHLRGRKTCYEDPILSYFWKLEPFHKKRVSTITVDRTMCELRRRSGLSIHLIRCFSVVSPHAINSYHHLAISPRVYNCIQRTLLSRSKGD